MSQNGFCRIEDEPAQNVLSVRTRGSVDQIPRILGRVYQEIMQYLGEQGQTPAGAPFVVYYNQDMQDLDMEVGFPLGQALPGGEN